MSALSGLAQCEQFILSTIEEIEPFDELEALHKREVINWIATGAPLFRIVKPDVPPKHLVAYFVIVDSTSNVVLLVDHLKAQKWLPTGGHVEPNEDPKKTVERELREELGISASFARYIGERPLFLTSTETVGLTAGHTDVSLWYVLDGSKDDAIAFDTSEFASVKWFSFEEILKTDLEKLDPHMHRFIHKLTRNISPL